MQPLHIVCDIIGGGRHFSLHRAIGCKVRGCRRLHACSLPPHLDESPDDAREGGEHPEDGACCPFVFGKDHEPAKQLRQPSVHAQQVTAVRRGSHVLRVHAELVIATSMVVLS